jgi:hypothetical protein
MHHFSKGGFVRDGAGFGAIPTDDEVIDDLADAVDLANGAADVKIIAVDSDDAFEADTIWEASHGKAGDFESVFGQEGSTDAGFQLPGIGIGFSGIL